MVRRKYSAQPHAGQCSRKNAQENERADFYRTHSLVFRNYPGAYPYQPSAGSLTIVPSPFAPKSEIENKNMTVAKMLFDRMSVSETQNHRPAYRIASVS